MIYIKTNITSHNKRYAPFSRDKNKLGKHKKYLKAISLCTINMAHFEFLMDDKSCVIYAGEQFTIDIYHFLPMKRK